MTKKLILIPQNGDTILHNLVLQPGECTPLRLGFSGRFPKTETDQTGPLYITITDSKMIYKKYVPKK